MEKGKVLFLNENEVKHLISAEQVLELVEEVLKAYARGETVNPVKLSLQIYPYHEGHINSMPSYIEPEDIAGVKVVSVFSENTKKYHLPTTIGTIILHNPDNGLPYNIMGGTHITDLRTGAVSGVMAKYLARKKSEVLAVIGAGAQGFTSMQMIVLAINNIKQVRVSDLSTEHRESFIKNGKVMFPNIEFISCTNNDEALYDSDIAVYATSASSPILEGSKLGKGITVICVSEKLTPSTIDMFDGWYVDFTACAIERYNADGRHTAELMGREYIDLTEDMVTGEIGDVMIGKTPGRIDDEQLIIAASVGMSIEDVIVAKAVYDVAMEQKKGLILDFQN